VIWRGYNEYTYVTCARCQRKVPVEQCEWDAGRLVCHTYNCKDRDIIGSKELRWAEEASLDTKEWQPHPKIVNPTDVRLDIEHVSANAGTY
jgi:hypothetical protein